MTTMVAAAAMKEENIHESWSAGISNSTELEYVWILMSHIDMACGECRKRKWKWKLDQGDEIEE